MPYKDPEGRRAYNKRRYERRKNEPEGHALMLAQQRERHASRMANDLEYRARRKVLDQRSKANRTKEQQAQRDRKHALKKLYGMTMDAYERMLHDQSNACAICRTQDPGGRPNKRLGRKFFAVDHDHSTGEIRGLLCHNCNQALGKLGDNIATLRRALMYLSDHTPPPPGTRI